MTGSVFGDRHPNEVFRRILPFLVLPFTLVLLVLDGELALYAGIAFGIGVVVLAAALSVHESAAVKR